VLTHHAGDLNIDHRIVHDAVLVATRPQPRCTVEELLFFEIPSSSEWRPPASGVMFSPNYYVNISTTFEIKIKALEIYQEELRNFPHPRSLMAIEAQARWRGATVGVDSAEAFILGRLIKV
jgi:LmbE family N-acetylglucosaminyl deacetylase